MMQKLDMPPLRESEQIVGIVTMYNQVIVATNSRVVVFEYDEKGHPKDADASGLQEKVYGPQFTQSEMETLWKAAHLLYNRLEDLRPAGGFKP